MKKEKEGAGPKSKLFLRFLDSHPEVSATLATSETLWAFIRWLEKTGYSIIHEDDLLTAPLRKFAKMEDLE